MPGPSTHCTGPLPLALPGCTALTAPGFSPSCRLDQVSTLSPTDTFTHGCVAVTATLHASVSGPTSRPHFQGQLRFCVDAPWNFRLTGFPLKRLPPPDLPRWVNAVCSCSVTRGKPAGSRALAVTHRIPFPALLTRLPHHRGSES